MAKQTTKTPDLVVQKKHKLDLPCILTEAQIIAKADDVSKLHVKSGELKIRKKTLTDEISGEIKGIEGAVSKLLGQIRTRTEVREVRCHDLADHVKGTITTVRLDTGEPVKTRVMFPEERQQPLRGIDGGKAGSAIDEASAAREADDADGSDDTNGDR